MTAVEIENVLATPELHELFESAEHTGSLRYADLVEVLEPLRLDAARDGRRHRELEQRGIEVLEHEPATTSRLLRLLRRSRSPRRRRRTRSSSFSATPAAIRC